MMQPLNNGTIASIEFSPFIDLSVYYKDYIPILIEKLLSFYSEDHEVVLYVAGVTTFTEPSILASIFSLE